MKREHFVEVVEEALDSLPQEFRSRIQNVAVLLEDVPPNQRSLNYLSLIIRLRLRPS